MDKAAQTMSLVLQMQMEQDRILPWDLANMD